MLKSLLTNSFILVKYFVFLVATFVSFYVAYKVEYEGYANLWILPFTYCLCAPLLLRKINIKSTIFFIILNCLIFVRYVVLPFYLIYAPLYGGSSLIQPKIESLQEASILISYELFVCTLVLIYLENKRQKNNNEASFYSSLFVESKKKFGWNKNIIYILFILIVFILLSRDIRWFSNISFFIPMFMGIEYSSEVFLYSYLFILVKQLIFIYAVSLLARKYRLAPKKRYIIFLLILISINIGVFKGGNRADILVTSITSVLLVLYFFSRGIAIKIALIGSFLLFIVFSSVTDARNYVSYTRGHNKNIDKANMFQSYVGSPYNVAIAIETSQFYPESKNIKVLAYDIVRPLFGVNLIVKNWDIKYSNQFFNKRYYLSDHETQILPSIGQGYLFFGPLFAPLISIFIIFLAYRLYDLAYRTSSVVMFYFLTLSFVRFSFFMGQNLMIMMSDLSFNLFLIGSVYILNKHFKIK